LKYTTKGGIKMGPQDTIAKLDKINIDLEKTYQTSLNIGKVFAVNELRAINGGGMVEVDKQVILKNIWSNKASVTWGKWAGAGSKYPDHMHEESSEYLICITGSFSVTFSKYIRILKIGECVSLPKKTIHSVTALEDNSEMMAICVPEEQAYITL
jgi:mannose-6-phosphate isomerase-like protein (cupin superfamily)